MGIRIGLRTQIVLVVALFVASLAVLLSSSLAAVWMPGREEQARRGLERRQPPDGRGGGGTAGRHSRQARQ